MLLSVASTDTLKRQRRFADMNSQHWRVYVVVNGVAEVAGFHATFESAEKDAIWLQEHGYKVEIGHL